jgi:acyl-CoA thioester hydrolase
MLRAAGVEQRALASDQGVSFRVQDCRIEYREPALLDDEIEVRSHLTALAGARLEAEQEVVRGDAMLARLEVRLACVGAGGRPTRLPPDLRRALAPYCRTKD